VRPSSPAAQKAGGTLTIVRPTDPVSLDPQLETTAPGAWVYFNMLEPLLTLDEKMQVKPALATSYEVMSPTKVRFKLRPGVKFHNGQDLTSADVKATYERLRNPPAGVVSTRKATFADIDTIETPDPLTVVFKLKKPNASMLANFASPWDCVYSAAKLKQDPRFPERNILGTGPFTFAGHVAGSHWTGRKFDNYFKKGKPYLNGYVAIFISGAPMVNALSAGEVLVEFRGQSPADRDRIMKALGNKGVVQEMPWVCSLVVTFNTKKKPFDNAQVRRALSLAIDRHGGAQALSKVALVRHVGGILRPGYDLAASEKELLQMPGFSKDINASRAEARKLLA